MNKKDKYSILKMILDDEAFLEKNISRISWQVYKNIIILNFSHVDEFHFEYIFDLKNKTLERNVFLSTTEKDKISKNILKILKKKK